MPKSMGPTHGNARSTLGGTSVAVTLSEEQGTSDGLGPTPRWVTIDSDLTDQRGPYHITDSQLDQSFFTDQRVSSVSVTVLKPQENPTTPKKAEERKTEKEKS